MRRIVILLVAVWAVLASHGMAQASPAASSDRKIISRAALVYPELAKKMHIHGTVKIEAVVRSNGAVKSTRVLGGNPVLVDAAKESVEKWKFEPAQAETTQIVQLTFDQQ